MTSSDSYRIGAGETISKRLRLARNRVLDIAPLDPASTALCWSTSSENVDDSGAQCSRGPLGRQAGWDGECPLRTLERSRMW